MPAMTRIGDVAVGVCCCHSDPTCVGWAGVYVSGDPTVNVEGSPDSRVGDIVVGCHAQVAVGYSATVNSGGLGTTRVGDATAGCTTGTNVSGAGTAKAG